MKKTELTKLNLPDNPGCYFFRAIASN
jgi:excinuclease UvrABC nuclease subunit